MVAVVRARRRRTTAARYHVRAIFDNAGFVIPGEDVKVAGVKVGVDRRRSTSPHDYKAAVVLDIDEPGYQDFRARRRVHRSARSR